MEKEFLIVCMYILLQLSLEIQFMGLRDCSVVLNTKLLGELNSVPSTYSGWLTTPYSSSSSGPSTLFWPSETCALICTYLHTDAHVCTLLKIKYFNNNTIHISIILKFNILYRLHPILFITWHDFILIYDLHNYVVHSKNTSRSS